MVSFKTFNILNSIFVRGMGIGWDGIYCKYGVATAVKIVPGSTDLLFYLMGNEAEAKYSNNNKQQK